MTPKAFLDLALTLPGGVLGRHQGGADLRVGGKIFATPADRPGETAVVSITAMEQEMLLEAEPAAFEKVKGKSGENGWTRITVANIDEATAQSVLRMAWRKVAPPKIAKAHPDV